MDVAFDLRLVFTLLLSPACHSKVCREEGCKFVANSLLQVTKAANLKDEVPPNFGMAFLMTPLSLHTVVVALFAIPLAGYVWWQWYQIQNGGSTNILFSTWKDRTLFVGYIVLFLFWSGLTHFTKDGDHSDAMLMFVTLMFKLCFSVACYRAFDGTFAALRGDAVASWRSLLYYVIPATLYSVSDVMRVDVLRRVEPSTYTVLFNLRMVFLAIVWERLLNRRLNRVHWVGLLLIMVGCVLKELPHLEGDGSSKRDAASRTLAYTEIMLLGAFTAVAAVVNEKLLKYEPVPVNLQNFAMYAFSLVPTALLTLSARFGEARLGGPRASALGVFDSAQWAAILLHPLVLAQCVVFALFGIVTGHFLKRFSNILREVATGIIILFIIPTDALYFGYTIPLIVCLGAMVVLAAIGIFAVFPVSPAPELAALRAPRCR